MIYLLEHAKNGLRGETMERKRADGYQLLSQYRSELMGIAMLWVMLFHAYEFHFGVPALDAVKQLGFGGVDMFILLSGLGLYGSIVRRREAFPQYFLRRCQRVLPAYWLVVGGYSLWLRMQSRISLTTGLWSLSTLHYWFQIPGSFNWYVPALLVLYALAPAWVRLLERSRHKGLLTLLVFPLAYGIYRLSIPLGLNYTSDFLDRMPAFALGLLAGACLLENQPLNHRHTAAWTGGALLGIAVAWLRIHGRLYISTCYMLAACVMPLCLALAYGLHLRRGPWKFLRFLGSRSLEIYLLNVIITREFQILAPLFDRDSRHILYYLTVYALNLLLAEVLHRGIQHASAMIAARWKS